MNERIQQIAEQANTRTFINEDGSLTPELHKFAELIVRECADICDKIYFENYPDAEDYERSEEGDAIKQHFGVKE